MTHIARAEASDPHFTSPSIDATLAMTEANDNSIFAQKMKRQCQLLKEKERQKRNEAGTVSTNRLTSLRNGSASNTQPNPPRPARRSNQPNSTTNNSSAIEDEIPLIQFSPEDTPPVMELSPPTNTWKAFGVSKGAPPDHRSPAITTLSSISLNSQASLACGDNLTARASLSGAEATSTTIVVKSPGAEKAQEGENEGAKKVIAKAENKPEEGEKPQSHLSNSPAMLQKDLLMINEIRADVASRLEFVRRPGPINKSICCTITRDIKTAERAFFPYYFLQVEGSDERKAFVAAARLRKKSFCANYLISADPADMGKTSAGYLGKLRANNKIGTQFTLYGPGRDPGKCQYGEDEGIRAEQCVIMYEKNVFGWKGPRKMTMLLPKMDKADPVKQNEITPSSVNESMLNCFKSHRFDNFDILQNKEPHWDPIAHSHVLNFHGRVKHPSVKNFQVVMPNNANTIIMQFGRVDKNQFVMDYTYPLSALQAFAICLSSFDNKLACE